MNSWRMRVNVSPKPSVLDPQGATVERSLVALGHAGVGEVRVGKSIELTVQAPDERSAVAKVGSMCGQLLANPVIETWTVAVLEQVPLPRRQAELVV